MNLRKLIFLFFTFFAVSQLTAQSAVSFYEVDLEKAKQMAQRQDKAIFVDAYAPWCIPCKKMETEFRDRDLANYFNNNFINVKVNMESAIGKQFSRYGIVFLPTFLILDKYGNVKIKVDRLITASNLLNIGKQVNEGDSFYASSSAPPPKPSNTTSVTRRTTNTPTTMKGVKKSAITGATIKEEPKKETSIAKKKPENQFGISNAKSEGEEKILYVLGSEDDMPPEILREEAYFRLNLMDGSHIKTSREYLETQSNWKTKENIQFIFDFLYNTSSKEFKYMIDNRAAFEEVIGKKKLQETIEILVYNKLYQGFPRPTLTQAQKLFSYTNPAKAKQNAKAYFIERLYSEGKLKEFRAQAEEYLVAVNYKDHNILYRTVFSYTDKELINRKTLAKCVKRMELATKYNNQSYEYFDLLASLYYKQRKKHDALGAAQMAVSLAKRYNIEYGATMVLIEMIEDL